MRGSASFTPDQRRHARRVLALFVAGRDLVRATDGRAGGDCAPLAAFRAGRFVSDADLLAVAGWCGLSAGEIVRAARLAAARDARLSGNGRAAA
jgi:hypothetical protein